MYYGRPRRCGLNRHAATFGPRPTTSFVIHAGRCCALGPRAFTPRYATDVRCSGASRRAKLARSTPLRTWKNDPDNDNVFMVNDFYIWLRSVGGIVFTIPLCLSPPLARTYNHIIIIIVIAIITIIIAMVLQTRRLHNKI